MKKITGERRNVQFSKVAWQQAAELCELWGENLSRVVSRAIEQAYSRSKREPDANRAKKTSEKS